MARLPCFAFHACQSAPLPPEGLCLLPNMPPFFSVPYLPPMLLRHNLRGAAAEEGVSAHEREEERERKRWRAQEAGACEGGAGAKERQPAPARGGGAAALSARAAVLARGAHAP